MLHKMRRRMQDEKGFTLIELLVVILIIGILAAIAIPSFLNQKSKANDASAKELARSAQTASETYATDHAGSYTGLSAAQVTSIEPTIGTTVSTTDAYLVSATPTTAGDGYTVTAHSTNGNTFSITRTATGSTSRSCTPTTGGASAGGCVAGTW